MDDAELLEKMARASYERNRMSKLCLHNNQSPHWEGQSPLIQEEYRLNIGAALAVIRTAGRLKE